ncbi:MAG: type IX secretion system membrane protein PorP/SprF [Bacteroidia bacterium]
MKSLTFSIFFIFIGSLAFAQNQELRYSTDLQQPGTVNPALAGLKEDVFRILTNTDLNNYSLLVEGRLPLKLGNYMLGVQAETNDYIKDNMFNLTYGRTIKSDKAWTFRYGGSLQMRSRSNLKTDGDSVAFSFVDLNGQLTEFQSLSQITGDLSYVNINFGASVNWKNLLVSAAINNAFSPDVSLLQGEERELPLQVNMTVGGFLNLGENTTLFPSYIGVYQKDDFLSRLSLNLHTKHFNVAGMYTADKTQSDLTASLAMHYKRSFFGLSYSQQLDGGVDNSPVFKVFINSSLFKSAKLFKSKFAKDIYEFY